MPSFLLKRLYVKGSLRNNDDGFQLQLRNSLGSGYAREMLPLTLDGQEIPKENCSFVVEGKETRFTQVSPENPFTLALNRDTTLLVKGQTLSPGAHRIGIGFIVQGIGPLSFEVTDVLGDPV
ncbi:MAG TPA: hypothetical protein G4O03_08865 [Dehalococcoidia bacterium]|nr:hypothetical protein [Dehalococcoidia bacterium]